MTRTTPLLNARLATILVAAGAALAAPSAHGQIFQRLVGSTDLERFNAIDQTEDGGTIAVGVREVPGHGLDVYAVRSDKDGNTVWARVYGDAGRDVGFSVVTLPDGSFAIGCQTDAVGGGWTTGLIRLDGAGNPIAAWAYPGTAGTDAVNVPDPGVSIDLDRASQTLVLTSNYQSIPTFHRADAITGAPISSVQHFFGLSDHTVEVGYTDVVPDPLGSGDALIAGSLRRTNNNTGDVREEPLFFRVDFAGNAVAPAIGYVLNPGAMPPWSGNGAAITTNGNAAFLTGDIHMPMGAADTALNILNLDLAGGLLSNFLIDLPQDDAITPAYRAADFRNPDSPLYIAGDVVNANGARRAMQVAVSAPLAVDFLFAYDRDTDGRAIVAMQDVCGQTVAGVANPASPPPGFGANDGYLVKTNDAGVSGCRESRPPFDAREYPIERYPLNPDPSPLPEAQPWPLAWKDIATKNHAHCFSPLCEPCPADWNLDGTVNTLDVIAFLNDWAAKDPRADVNGDGTVNTIDVIEFLNAWASGC